VSDSFSSVDSKLDEALEETFPASDPPANTVETGIHAQAFRAPIDPGLPPYLDGLGNQKQPLPSQDRLG